jgi:hypothetical protein
MVVVVVVVLVVMLWVGRNEEEEEDCWGSRIGGSLKGSWVGSGWVFWERFG